jgi:hypothetical protein
MASFEVAGTLVVVFPVMTESKRMRPSLFFFALVEERKSTSHRLIAVNNFRFCCTDGRRFSYPFECSRRRVIVTGGRKWAPSRESRSMSLKTKILRSVDAMQVRRTAVAACLGLAFLMVSGLAQAQYHLTNIVSNQVHQAPTIDPLLANPWGLARGATSPWWISDNDTGGSTLYEAKGTQVPLQVLIPTAGNGPTSPSGLNGPGTPTGIVFNGSSTDFEVLGMPAPFIFATLDGTISAWAPGVNVDQSIIAVDNPASNVHGPSHHQQALGEFPLRGR